MLLLLVLLFLFFLLLSFQNSKVIVLSLCLHTCFPFHFLLIYDLVHKIQTPVLIHIGLQFLFLSKASLFFLLYILGHLRIFLVLSFLLYTYYISLPGFLLL